MTADEIAANTPLPGPQEVQVHPLLGCSLFHVEGRPPQLPYLRFVDAEQVRRGRAFRDWKCAKEKRPTGYGSRGAESKLLSCIPQLRREQSHKLVRVRRSADHRLHRSCREAQCTACGEDGPVDGSLPPFPDAFWTRPLIACPGGCGYLFCDVVCKRRTSCPHLELMIDGDLGNAEALSGLGCQCECCQSRLPPFCAACDSVPCRCLHRSKWQVMYGATGLAEDDVISEWKHHIAETDFSVRDLGLPGPAIL